MKKQRLFTKDFSLVVLGQIISLFGNAILRFTLPLYLLRETGSSTLFGLVTACSFLPIVLLSMIGGILADRVNKRNMMVSLDFCTALLITFCYVSIDRLPTVPLFIITLMILYGISGVYQPTVQASIPLLVSNHQLMTANAIINQVNTLAGLIGPVIGGLLFGQWGLWPILIISILSFFASSLMEIFIKIPYQKRPSNNSVFSIAKNDLKESFLFVKQEQPHYFSMIFLITLFNMVLSAVVIVGMPVLIIQHLALSDTLYGFSQAALACGGLCGGIITAAFAQKLQLRHVPYFLSGCALAVGCIGVALFFAPPVIVSYAVITAMCFVIMGASTLVVVPIYTTIQAQTPPHLIGKIMAALIAVAMCGQPLGQAIYGVLFDACAAMPWVVVFGASLMSLLIARYSKKIFSALKG